MNMTKQTVDLIEKLAEIEHEQWVTWASNLAKQENLSPERLRRWGQFLIPYSNLPEEVKEHDRKWARKVSHQLLQLVLEGLPEEKTEYIEAFDNSRHRYQIPRNKRDDWYKFMEIPEDDERSWEVPEYAERIDGMDVKSNDGYNQALDDVTKVINDIFDGRE